MLWAPNKQAFTPHPAWTRAADSDTTVLFPFSITFCMYHSLSFLAYYFLEILVSPTHVFEAPPTLNHLHIIKFREERKFFLLLLSTCLQTLLLNQRSWVYQRFCFLFRAPQSIKSSIIGGQKKLQNVKGKWGYGIFVITEVNSVLSQPLTLYAFCLCPYWVSIITSGRTFPL